MMQHKGALCGLKGPLSAAPLPPPHRSCKQGLILQGQRGRLQRMKVHGCAETDLDSQAGGGPQGRVGFSGRLSTRGERWWLLPQAPSFRVAP